MRYPEGVQKLMSLLHKSFFGMIDSEKEPKSNKDEDDGGVIASSGDCTIISAPL